MRHNKAANIKSFLRLCRLRVGYTNVTSLCRGLFTRPSRVVQRHDRQAEETMFNVNSSDKADAG